MEETATIFSDETALRDFIHGRGHGVKGLADRAVPKVPQKYVRPPHERIVEHARRGPTPPHLYDQLHQPISLKALLDGSDDDREVVVDKIVRAAEALGYFQVVDHGVPIELLEAVKCSIHEFFQQRAEEKLVHSTGKIATYRTSYVSEKEPVWDWRDSLTLSYTNDAEAMENWPTVCKEIMLEYMKASSKMSATLVEALLGKLGGTVDERRFEGLTGHKVVHMNYYPPCPNPELTTGTRCHSDKSLITALLQDRVGGLSVKAATDVYGVKKGDWIDVPPVEGALVINVGDVMQILSNGRYKSPEHRVRTSRNSSRISVAVFTNPVMSENIGPLPQTITEANGVAFYREFVYKDYLVNYVTTVHTGKRPLDFAEIDNHA
uniref:Fe2OG dioxygenase domain-containing protein n=1 Tax=Kalanchoe fedtschenkoi TaxID=63787 RepID=A0A7N0RFB3_KALFE